MNASRSSSCTSCSFFTSAPASGGMALVGSRSRSSASPIWSAISSLSQSTSSEVDGFFFSPGTLRMSKKISSASCTSSWRMLGKCTSTIFCRVTRSGKAM
ncbi:hypothetical protein D3C86_2053370 [compost metagenome]